MDKPDSKKLGTDPNIKSSKCMEETEFELGIYDLENSLTEIQFPPINHKKKERYSMGNGCIVNSADEAADLFLKREFSFVNDYKEKPHPPTFVPDIFISKLKSMVKILISKKLCFKCKLKLANSWRTLAYQEVRLLTFKLV